MNNFKNFKIKPSLTNFVGDKIKINKILNKEIIIQKFKIEDSKAKQGTKCLTLQIEYKEENHIIFTGSKILQEMIIQVPEDGFPFKTIIVLNNERLEFT
ncbi:hypothetical protein AS589_09280 [Empedobacter brevis]|uniref:hypothetical protein n=1 Tax=Empedobacter brevis TaxID=247 RepID=UPI00131FA5D6|nr:hypothetical protein [Empedobacter brevis]QHC84947.1 hypothetical protein AS589_09280 [Empedobacter brevis]